ncbi:MAG: exodeoxyribonuclease VII small subunit [Lachnospiraceae bacterium]|nr:exodeoxyribonuclease VII small subunit [Lachnospiraceae bacterium]
MAAKKKQEEYTLEQAFSKLNDIVKQLDSGTQSLEEAFASYAEGMEMIRLCNTKIDKVEKQCLVIRESGEDHEL